MSEKYAGVSSLGVATLIGVKCVTLLLLMIVSIHSVFPVPVGFFELAVLRLAGVIRRPDGFRLGDQRPFLMARWYFGDVSALHV